jgi:flagellar protein FliO/FliZ
MNANNAMSVMFNRFSPFVFVRIHARTLFGLLLAAAPSVLSAAEKAQPAPVGAGSVFQVILALGFVLALILGLAWMLRRLGAVPQGAAGALRVIGGISVGQRERIVLVQVGETQLVVGIAPGQIRTLHVLDKPVAEPPAQGGDGDFAQRLASALRRGGKS